MEIITKYRGESFSVVFMMNEAYDMVRMELVKCFIGGKSFDLVASGQSLRCELTSTQTQAIYGINDIILHVDDSVLGVVKVFAAKINLAATLDGLNNSSVNTGIDIAIPITINETAITVGDVVYSYVKGDKGDPGNGIQSITLLAIVGLVKTYRILFTDATTFDYDVTDGEQGIQGEQGLQGEQGEQGLKGDKGDAGDDGITYYTENHKEDLSSQVDGVNKIFTLAFSPMDTPCVDFRINGKEAEFDIVVSTNTVTLSFAPVIGDVITCYYQTNTTAIPNIAGKQDKADLALATTDKTVVGAINEVRITANGKENTGVAQSLVTQLINGAASGYDTLKELEDKIIAINSIIGGSTPDGDSIVNTVAELLSVFATFPEGSDMVTLLTAKLNTSDVYNALDQLLDGKALDARQGKVLNDLCTGLRTDLTNHNHAGVYEPIITKSAGFLSWTGSAWAWITTTFQDASKLVTAWSATVLNTNYPSEKLVKDSLDLKVDKVAGKGLSEIDVTHEMAEIYGATSSTGWVESISIIPVDATHISVNSAEGFIIKNTGANSETPLLVEVMFEEVSNVLVSNIATADITYFLVNESGVLYQQTTFPTPEQRRDNLFIGRVSHPNRTSILAIVNTPDFATSPMSQLRDMFEPIKMINSGISPYADGANLGFNISGGKLTGLGINASVNVKNPNQVTISGKIPASFYYRTQTGGSTGLVSVLTPGFYDVGGTITAISTGGDSQANRSTNVRIYQFSNGNVVAQYGQTVYSSLSLAVAGIPTEQFIEFSNVDANAILIGIISVRRAATVLNNTSFAIFTPASMFGEVVNSTNGTSITDLQGIYGNSSTPEITTDDERKALTLKDGTSSPTNNQFEIQNFNGVLKASINGNGSYESVADYGSNEAPLVYDASNWTLTSGWIFSGNSLDKNSSGTNDATALLGVAPVAQQVYKLTFTVAASVNTGTFVGNITPSFGGTVFNAITAVGTYTYYIHAVATTKLSFGPYTNGTRFSITDISITKKTNLIGDLIVGGDVFFSGNRILNRNTNTPVFYWYPNGAVYVPGAFTVVGAFAASTTITSSSSITGRQLCTTTGSAATTTGAVNMTLSSNGQFYLSAALTGPVTMNITAPVAGGRSILCFIQGATAQSLILSLTGVTWRQAGVTGSSTNTLTVSNISIVNANYIVELYWMTATLCYVTVHNT
jgi:hypothetical protein